VRPATEHGLAQSAHLRNDTLLSDMGVGIVSDGLVEGVEDVVQVGR
jgi:hypothetical protein